MQSTPDILSTSMTLYSAAELREIDRTAIDDFGTDGFTLMSGAAAGAFEAILASWPLTNAVVAWCGTGNNGGDGLVLAGLAAKAGLSAIAVICGDRQKIRGTAGQALAFALDHDVRVIDAGELTVLPETTDRTIMVDALLGTGASGSPRGIIATAIAEINRSGSPVLAIDLPTGLDADTGETPGICIKADMTVTFIGLKRCFGNPVALQYCGRIVLDDLGIPAGVFRKALRQE
jgi:hydroxyethylthiazole kinase-like uncharacterized protein yjeF